MTTKRPLYRELAALVEARLNCIKSGNTEWEHRHYWRIARLWQRYAPSGSGLDGDVAIDLSASTPDKLVIRTEYHHMNNAGMYDGWTKHDIIVTPSLAHNYNLRITGRDRNGIKDYIAEVFGVALETEIYINTEYDE